MRVRIIKSKTVVVGCMLSLLLASSVPVIADTGAGQMSSHLLAQYLGKSPNPWAVEERTEPPVDAQRLFRYQDSPQDNYQTYSRVQRDRFVTPEILQSLKQQQSHYQLAPSMGSSRQMMHVRPRQRQYIMPSYTTPSYGMNYSAPIYDAPAVSPWANSPDMIYQGQSFPLVPNEAIGGLPPMPLYGDDSIGGMYGSDVQNGNNVFNPFTFIPNNDLH